MFRLEKNPLLSRNFDFFFQIPYGYLALFSWKKRFSNFYFFLSIWSSDEIKLLKFGTFRIPIFPIGKKSTFVPKIGVFVDQKGSPIFIIFFLIWSLGEIKLLKFGTFRIPIFPIGKNSDLVPKILKFWFKNTNDERPFFVITTATKRFPNFFYYFFKMKFRQNKFCCIWKIFEIFFGKWKKIHFCSENWG